MTKTNFTLLLTFGALLLCVDTLCQNNPDYVIACSISDKDQAHKNIYVTDAEGKSKIKVTDFAGGNGYSAWSPDGKRLAFYAKYDDRKTWSIHTINIDGTDRRRLTDSQFHWDNAPTWSPDGSKIAFAKAYKNAEDVWQHEIWIMNADGTDQQQIQGLSGGGPSFAPDGRIVFHSQPGPSEIFIANIDGTNLKQLTENDAEEWHPEVSADGQRIAFMSDRTGNHEIYSMNINGTGQRQLTKTKVDSWYPSWSPDGSQIIFSFKTNDVRTLYKMNQDGSSVHPIVRGGSQAAWLKLGQEESLVSRSFQDYFGETPPGLTPVEFAPDIVSPEGLFEGGTFSPDGKEFYFTRKNGKYERRTFFVIRYENGHWGEESETEIRWPKFSEDGKMIYGGKGYRVRTDTGWSELKNQGEFLKDQAHGISLSAKGTYYFAVYKKEWGTNGALYYSCFIDGKQENPVKMNADINTGGYVSHPHIAPDESYLMWDAKREDGYGESDIYISFRGNDGSWLPAINMGSQINTELNESSPKVSHDGKYLFFSRGQWEVKEDGSENWVGKSYWVSAQVIEQLRPQN